MKVQILQFCTFLVSFFLRLIYRRTLKATSKTDNSLSWTLLWKRV